jgi:hypothetical protein
MRSNIDPQKIAQLMKVLGREARGPGCIYFTGGANALLIGWRSSTVDSELIRFPSLNPDLLRNRIEQFIERCESTSESDR